MAHIYVTRQIPDTGLVTLEDAGHTVAVSAKRDALTKDELLEALRKHNPDALLCLLTDTIDTDVFDAAPNIRIVANYAVGYENINLSEAAKRGIVVTNTPDVLTDSVAEHTIALMLAVLSRVAEGDRFVRRGAYKGWDPMLFLGTDAKNKILGIVGAGRIGRRVAEIAQKGLGMRIVYTDMQPNAFLDDELHAEYCDELEDVCVQADVLSLHVPLLESTHHLLSAERIARMKPSAYVINTSRGPVIDEAALTTALIEKRIRGAALDVFEHEPQLTPGLSELENVVLTPHMASATQETREKMSEIASENIQIFFDGGTPPQQVTTH